MFLRIALSTLACSLALTLPATAQHEQPASGPVLSPPKTTSVMLDGEQLTINYGAPSMRGRKIMGGLVPFGQVWRTGANSATSFDVGTDIAIGDLKIRAGHYTLYTLPNADPTKWLLIINKQTKQWGTEYHAEQDLGRVPMHYAKLARPQEMMSISFEKRSGTGKSAELHVRWETTDEWVVVKAE